MLILLNSSGPVLGKYSYVPKSIIYKLQPVLCLNSVFERLAPFITNTALPLMHDRHCDSAYKGFEKSLNGPGQINSPKRGGQAN